jgi:hypothetical protein
LAVFLRSVGRLLCPSRSHSAFLVFGLYR